MKKQPWYSYLWIWPIIYFTLGFFNIIFAWLGMIDFLVPLLFAIIGGNKKFCNRYCGRGMLLSKLGHKLSRYQPTPAWVSSQGFRSGFLVFFLAMFLNIIFQTYLVAAGAENLHEVVKLFWTIALPWSWAYSADIMPWVAQFAYGFYSLMLTSMLLGLIFMFPYKPRTWCSFCPMGTMAQKICQLSNK